MDFMQLLFRLNVDAETLLNRFCGNEGLAKRFLLKFPEDKTFASLNAAVEENNTEAVLAGAHALKGIALNLGLDTLGNQASELVNYLRGGQNENVKRMYEALAAEYGRIIKIINETNS